MKMQKTDDMLAWIDVETTGLDARNDHLLQVACVVTDTDLNVIDGGYNAVVKYSSFERNAMREEAKPYVRDMHDRNGLWKDLPYGQLRSDVDAGLLAYIKEHAPGPRQARVAGNSVRLDLNFLERYLPSTYSHLHYRFVDVSGVEALAGWWFGVEPFPKAGSHDAMTDVREAIDQLRRLRGCFGPLD
jgi:oligoribonuclease